MAVIIDEHTQYVDINGKPLVNGTVTIGDNGSSDPANNLKDIFSDAALTIALANPQTLDSFGRTDNKIFTDGQYSFLLKNSAGSQIVLDTSRGTSTQTQGAIILDNVSGINTITASSAGDPITAYVDKQQYTLTLLNAPTGPTTINIDSVGEIDLVTSAGDAVRSVDFTANQILTFVFNTSSTSMLIMSGSGNGDVVSPGSNVIDGRPALFDGTDGELLMQALTSSLGPVAAPIFVASGTWTRNTATKSAIILCVAGGGGGGGSGSSAGGGGGSGGSSITFADSLVGVSDTVTIGSGGTAGAASGTGGTGGNSSVGTLALANAGEGGTSAGFGGAGGLTAGAIGTFLLAGGAGAPQGDNSAGGAGGNGADSFLGGGGAGRPGGNNAGLPATTHGGGGGGAGAQTVAGGAGFSGAVFIIEFG